MSTEWQWDRSHDGPLGSAPGERGYCCGYKLAHFGYRILAGLVDWGLLYGLPVYFLVELLNGTPAVFLAYVLPLTLLIANSGYMAAKTTQSLGKRLLNVHMVRIVMTSDGDRYISYVPVEVAIARIFLHYPDYFLACIGFIWAFFSPNRATLFSDTITRTLHFCDEALPQAVYVPRARAVWPTD